MGGLQAQGQRVNLRPIRDDDVPLIEPWYGEAAAAVHGLGKAGAYGREDLERQVEASRTEPAGGLLAITRTGEDAPMGMLDYRVGVPEEGWAMIGCVALETGARRWGLGQDAVRLFEENAARRWGVRRFRANVDVHHGLALYFWLRLGYHPLGPTTDSQGHDVLPMVRAG